ncbi:lipopolysaccharide biosynthesis protein [Microbacterium sp. Sa4CUA7]|uniref:Lipopolysaccharide biosynthesis protein n=1 Tax=Microbacterium pullorum TaxID=2762236 RepID=A0ABR8S501_9MICO|nr:lipopolysaccharide biosynthesis protein [Microbacterium pullorum]MBD7958553.1 lipopolysaccharide biosynthesis protein [Microbacterium pullorum]
MSDGTPDQAAVATGLTGRAASSVGWLTAQTWTVKVGGFVTIIVLARLLTPEDFGSVAVAMTVLPLVYLIADMGFGTYLMQAEALGPRTASTAFWYSFTAGLLLAAGMAAAAPGLEMLFGVADVAGVIMAMSPVVLLSSLASVPVALLRRAMRFRTLSIQAAVAGVVGQVMALALAFSGAGVWALVAQVCVSQVVVTTGAWIAARWIPSLRFSAKEFGIMASFGTKVVGVNAISVARLWGENVIISNVLGAAALGQLSIAQRLVQTTQDLAGSAIAPVSTIVFATVRSDPDRLRSGYDRALGATYLMIMPALCLVAVAAPAIVPFLFGPQWTTSIPVAQALAVAAIFTAGAALDHGLFYGLGRPGAWLVYAVVVDASTIAMTAFAVRFGIAGVAVGFVTVATLACVARWFIVAHAIRARARHLAAQTARALLLAGAAGMAGWAAGLAVAGAPALIRIAVAGTAVMIVHFCLARWLLPQAFDELGRQVRSRLPTRGRRRRGDARERPETRGDRESAPGAAARTPGGSHDHV